jgi:hypothetical protein
MALFLLKFGSSNVKIAQTGLIKQSLGYKLTQTIHNNSHLRVRRVFSTTPKRHVPPILWALIKPISKLGALILGRYI